MRILTEDQILNEAFRSDVISEIIDTENVTRKKEFLKRYEIFKDMTKKYVVESLVNEGLAPETVTSMSNRAANISICRKIVNKLARTYSGGVSRVVVDDEETSKQVSELARVMCFDEKMAKSDRYRELHKNNAIQIVPERVDQGEEISTFKLKMRVLNPWQYDVIEDQRDREIPKVYILSDFIENDNGEFAATEQEAGVHRSMPSTKTGDSKDQIIADHPRDNNEDKKRLFIWWSDSFHFTTDENGIIIPEKSPENLENPIGMMPFANNAEDQDGFFWALGGNDLIEGSVLVNKLLTDMFYIAYLQGFGQYVVTGKNISDRIKIGPNNAIILDYDPAQDDPQPNVSVVSANPPLEAWMKSVEQYVALLLTTNNLSPANVSGNLDAQTFPSGIAMLIEQSESTQDISDKQKEYKDIERRLWEVIRLWNNLIFESGDSFTEEFESIGELPSERFNLAIKFNEIKPVVSEGEILDNLKKRKELGLNEEIDLIMIDNPDLTREEAEQKLLRIKEAKLNQMSEALGDSLQMNEVSGITTEVNEHVHEYMIAADGSGETTVVDGHKHDIINGEIQEADGHTHGRRKETEKEIS